jgi:hypothetical protein
MTRRNNMRKGTNQEIDKLLKKYDRMVKKNNSRITIFLNRLDKKGVVMCNDKITNDNKELIRECLVDHDWKKLFDISSSNRPCCPIHGGKEAIDYNDKNYKYNIMKHYPTIEKHFFIRKYECLYIDYII